MATTPISTYEQEILACLPHEHEQLHRYRTDLEVYHGTYVDPELYYYDREERARRDLPLMTKVVDTLTAYAYQEPPTRQVHAGKAATDYLDLVYRQNRANVLLHASDRYRHAADIFAIQVHATGDPDKPIRLIGWQSDQFVVWTDPEDQTTPQAVCTIDRFDHQTRYRLWTAEEVRTYVTTKWNGETSGARAPVLQSAEPNPYGRLPFAFQHLLPPVTKWVEGGIGDTLARMHRHVNFRTMISADWLRRSQPKGFLLGVDANKSLARDPRPGEWQRLSSNAVDSRMKGGDGINPDVKWLGPPMDWLNGDWDDLKYYWNLTLETVGVPAASIPLDKVVIATVSGAALVARNMPLFAYARKTQEQYRHYETELAKLVFEVSDAAYGGFSDVVKDFDFNITFGEVVPDLPPDSPDDYLDGLKDRGELSEIQVVMKRFGFTREQAVEHLEQVAKDEAELAKIRTKYAVPEQQTEVTPPLADDELQAKDQTTEQDQVKDN